MPQTDVLVNIDAKADKAIRESKKLREELNKLKNGPNQANKSFKSMRGETQGLMQQFGPIATKMGAMALAAKTMYDAWFGSRKEAERLAALIENRQPNLGLLRQLSGGSERTFQDLKQQSQAFAVNANITEQQAIQSVFAATSGGLNTPQNMLAFQRFGQLGDVPQAIEAVSTIQSSFGGSAPQILNALVGASQEAKFDINQLAGSVAVAGQDLQKSGVDLPTFLGAVASQKGRKSADIVANQLKALAAKHQISGFGGSLDEWVGTMDGLSGKELVPFLGTSIEAIQGLDVYRGTDRKIVEATRRSIDTSGTDQSLLSRSASVGQGPAAQLGRVRAARDLILEERGQEEVSRQLEIEAGDLMAATSGENSMRRWANRQLHGIFTSVFGGEESGASPEVDAVLQMIERRAIGRPLEAPVTENNAVNNARQNVMQILYMMDPTRSQTLKQGGGDSFGGNR